MRIERTYLCKGNEGTGRKSDQGAFIYVVDDEGKLKGRTFSERFAKTNSTKTPY